MLDVPVTAIVNNLSLKVSNLVRHLLLSDKRILTYSILRSDLDLPSFFVTKTNVYLPCELPVVEHEVAHWLELASKRRWLLKDWDLKFLDSGPKFLDSGPKFWAAYSREIRVRTIQNILDSSKAQRRLYNHYYWGNKVAMNLGFGRFNTIKHVKDWEEDLISSTFSRWNEDRIVVEWQKRIYTWKHWAETKD